jgi:NodT family efflux transporter outer membrane factor (OMF) lipoprotein
MTKSLFRIGLLLASVSALAGCNVGPDYHRPAPPLTPVFKETAGWKPAARVALPDNGDWWAVYDDPALNALEARIDVSNQTLKADEAQLRQARAVVAAARASYFPTISLGGSGQKSSVSSSRSNSAGSGGNGFSSASADYQFTGSAAWDVDLWGKIRRTVEGDVATAQASAADLAAARLSIEGELATDYLSLRAADSQTALLADTVAAYRRSLEITRNQFAVGVAAPADVVTAEAQLEAAEAQEQAAGVQRAQYEHAIAVLTGAPPAELSLPQGALAANIPVAPAGVPSDLLERRPDVIAAERQMAAANAAIGVAKAGYFPTLNLSGSAGYETSELGRLFSAGASLWSLGADIAQPLFNGGATSAAVEQSRAAYDQSVATYRQTVLTAFQQVEDEVSTLRILQAEAATQAQAVASAREALRITTNEYEAGTVAYTSVVTAQATLLADRQTALSIEETRLLASVSLIQAVGGGWDATRLPDRKQIEAGGFRPL